MLNKEDLRLSIIFDDLECPLTLVSKSQYTYKLNISKMACLTDIVTLEH